MKTNVLTSKSARSDKFELSNFGYFCPRPMKNYEFCSYEKSTVFRRNNDGIF
jgi:hypothetical protein